MLRAFRLIHLYLGVFIAPALLFFALTGALQTFNLHESHAGSDYKPAKWITALAQLHKKQTLTIPPRRPRPADSPVPASSPGVAPASTTQSSKAASHEHRGLSAVVSSQPSVAPGSAPASLALSPAGPPQKAHLPLKIFFLIVSVGLFTSALTGIYMAYKYNRSKLIVSVLLIAGVVIPLALLPF